MTTPVLKLKIFPKPVIKGKMDVRFPAKVEAKNFLTVARANGIYTFDVDYTLLTPIDVSDPTTAMLAVLDETAGVYKIISLASLLISGLDIDLQSIAALTGTGILSRTADDTWSLRSLVAPAAGITITNPGGVAGNQTFSLANDLAALEGLSSTGIAVRSTADTWVQRSIAGTANEITLTNGDGVGGNPTVSLPIALTFTGKTVTGGTFNSPALVTPALGTPASGVATNLTGTASGLTAGHVTTNANMTGDVTSVGNATTIAANAVTNSKLATAADGTIKSNISGVTAAPSDNTISAVLDKLLGSTRGSVIYRGASGWAALAPGSAGDVLTTQGSSADPSWEASSGSGGVSASALVGFISGFTLSTAGSSGTFAIAAGSTVDTSGSDFLRITSGTFTKTTGAWTAGSGNGALDSGSIAASTWYHVFVIKRTDTGVVDVLVSASATNPTLPSPYTLFRRIGAMKTDSSSKWTAFLQIGNTFWWNAPVGDVSVSSPGTTGVLRTISTPLGVSVEAIMTVIGSASNGSTDSPQGIYISDPALPDTAASNTVNSFYVNSLATTTFGLGATMRVFTNTSSQVRTRLAVSTSGTTLIINTQGWVDPL
jgi:hypothetical protein